MRLQLVLLLCGASVSALRQPIGRITSLNRNRLVADEADSLFYRSPRLVNHADGVLAAPALHPALQPALWLSLRWLSILRLS